MTKIVLAFYNFVHLQNPQEEKEKPIFFKNIETVIVTGQIDKKSAEFPYAITTRGSKHLIKLAESIKKGYKPFVLFLTQIEGINKFKIAKDIDAEYYKNYLKVKKIGVKFLAYRCKLNDKEIKIEKKIDIIDD